jgi:PAS domain S-box-containing protein
VPDKEHPPSTSANGSAGNVGILLVDDNRANLLTLRAILDDLHHDLVDAFSGEEALKAVHTREFAVILLDVMMPGISGFEAAERIRANPSSRHTPIIFVTANDVDRQEMEAGYGLGAVDFLTKPLSAVSLRAKVKVFIDLFKEKRRAAQEAEQLRLMIQGTVDYAIFLLDPDGRVATWNAGAERIKKYSAEEILGQHFSRFYPDEAIRRGWPDYELKMAVAEGKFEDEGWRVRKDGSQFWANVVITALHDRDGVLRGFAKITRDMTERKHAEENARFLLEETTARRVAEENSQLIESQRERLRVTLASIGDAVISTDAEGRVDFLNPVAQRLTGWREEEAIHRPLEEVFVIVNEETRQPVENPALRALQDGRVQGLANHTILIAKDGTESPIDDSAAPIKGTDGKIIGSVLVFRDISLLKQANAALRDSARRKDEFLALLAHELRNPLAPIRNSLELLELPDVDVETAKQSREVMKRQVHHLVRLVDDLLDVSRVMRGKIELRKESIELSDIVARAVETANSVIETQGHKLDIAIPSGSLVLQADPVRLCQVLSNLLVNAAKYTQPGGHIWLTAHREGNFVRILVRDNGIGIAPDMLPHVFELFVQADHTSTKAQGGLGIGLTIVKSLVELHGGTVAAHSPGLGKGSEFELRIPLGTKPKPVGATKVILRQQSKGASGHRLLIVDDNRDAASSLAMLLRLQGHEVQVAHDGTTALDFAESYGPTMVLLDIGMPGMDGYEVARRMRQIPGLENVVLAALTGWGQPEDRRRTADAGFDHHLVKPLEPILLDSILARSKR